MIDQRSAHALASVVATATGEATDRRLGLEASGFAVDPRAVAAEDDAIAAAADGRWGDVLVALLVCEAYEPDVYRTAWRQYAEALLALLGGAANTPPPAVPAVSSARRWASSHGSAEELPTGHLRIQVPTGMRQNLAVVLPPVAGGRHG